MRLPANTAIVRGEIADYWYSDGILYAHSKSVLRTVENLSGNVVLVKEITGCKKVPLLIYLSNSPVPGKAARRFSTEKLPEVYTAMAMVSSPGLAQLMMKILFRLRPPPIPMKSFTNDKEAKKWLQQFV